MRGSAHARFEELNQENELDSNVSTNHRLATLEQELRTWCEEPGLQPAETCRRNTAREKILECYLQQSSELVLEGLYLNSLPECINSCSQLKVLNLSKNNLTTLPDFIADFSQLTTLDLTSNQLTALPEIFKDFQNLEILRVTGNKLSSLPESLGKCQNLQTLEVSANQLPKLPEFLGNCENLKIIRAARNKLTELPETLGNCSKLEGLHIGMNPELTTLPESLTQCSLKYLGVKMCSKLVIPESIQQKEGIQFV